MEDLLKLEACTSNNSITTPLEWRKWNLALEHYPDKAFKDYIVKGLKEGFRIGYKGPSYQSAKTNIKLALEQSQVVICKMRKGHRSPG